MIRNLQEKLKTISAPKPAAVSREAACLVRDTRVPLAELPALATLQAWHLRALGGPADLTPDLSTALFLDTETTGLSSGSVAFLVGAGFLEGETFTVRQFLMRDYGQEPTQLRLFSELLADKAWLVTFNGKSFDVPLLRDRFTLQRLDTAWTDLPHFDLLHAARRVWKLRLSEDGLGAGLQVLEREILGLARLDDLPSAEVPARFFSYLKTGDMALLEDVLRHNGQDIISLAHLLGRLAQACDAVERQPSLLDVFSLGRSFDRAGERERARRCFRAAAQGSLAGQARWSLADSHRRVGEWSEAAAVYQEMALHGEGGTAPYVRLAILAEHRQKDARQALAYTRQAMLRAGPEEMPALERRRARLAEKLQREGLPNLKES